MKKKRRLRKGLLAKLCSPLLVIFSLLLAFQIYKLNILPVKYLIPVVLVVVLLALILFLLSMFKTGRRGVRILVTILTVILTIVYGAGNYYIYKTDEMFAKIDDLTDKIANTETIRVMEGSPVSSLSDLNGKTIGLCTAQDAEGIPYMEKALEKDNVQYTKQDFASVIDLTAALYNGEIDAMIINDGFLGIIHDVEDFTFVTTSTKVIYSEVYYTPRPNVIQDSQDQVNVTKEPFTVLISGNDTYGSLGENSRSDVNMLVTVNPKSGEVLMTSIPRDYYVEVDCPEGVACAQGEMDKLTHTGLHGIETTEATIEKALGININYTVRVNFSSLVNLVDALGGIDVVVDKGLAVKTFYANETLEGVSEGKNHLEGERALAFARERHAYVDGDNQRVRNQQIVLRAIIDKITSPSILLNYGNFVDAIGGAFETDMPSSQMKDLIRYQLTVNPHWKFESCSLRGEGSTEYCAELGMAAYVAIPDEESVRIAREKIEAVLNGKSAESIQDPGASDPAGTIEQPEQDEETGLQDDTVYDPDDPYDSSAQYEDPYSPDLQESDSGYTDPYDPNDAGESQYYNPNWTLDDEQ